MANTWLHCASDGGGITPQSTDILFLPISGQLTEDHSARTTIEVRDRTGFTSDNGFARVLVNSMTVNSTLSMHDDGTDVNPTITITTTTGTFTSTSSATIATASLICSRLAMGTSSMATHGITLTIASLTLEHATSEKSLLMGAGVDCVVTRDNTEFIPYGGALGDADTT